MAEPFNELTPAEAERLAMLAEECSEVVQIICKTLRHGYDSTHPKGGITNREKILDEYLDILAVIQLMGKSDDLRISDSRPELTRKILEKAERKLQYSHHQ